MSWFMRVVLSCAFVLGLYGVSTLIARKTNSDGWQYVADTIGVLALVVFVIGVLAVIWA